MRHTFRVMAVAGFVAVAVVVGAGTGWAQAPAAGNPTVVIDTPKGAITIELYPQEAPKTVENFLKLVKANFYNRQHFHRVESFVVQIGDPGSKDMANQAAWGRRGNGQPLGVAEISKKLKHKKGAVGMAHAGDATKADSQFYIVKLANKIPEGQYAIFGQVISGMDVVDKLELGDLVRRMSVK